ncbi:MAG: pyridoxamine 5'-phosphate oxidase family protein [Thermodesulfobacteriota bacterium]
MDLKKYFENVQGRGVLATADAEGRVDVAVFARPHVMEDGTVGFIMPERLSHRNLKSNPHAAYLFMEDGGGWKGVRLFLTKLREEKDTELLRSLKRRRYEGDEEGRHLVFFKVEKVLPLIGPEKES